MSLIEKVGFFPDYYLNIKNTCTEPDINNFGKLKSDLERVSFVSNLKSVRDNELKLSREFIGKSEQNAADLKNKGNEAFKNKKWIEALMLYSKSYITMPGEKKQDVSIILANRSAALFHLEKFDETIEDICRSIKMGYPKDMSYKLYERQARCYLGKKDLPKAMEAFKHTIHALDESKLPLEKKSKIEKDALVMIKMLERDLLQKQKESSVGRKATIKKTEFLSGSVTFDYNDEEGRFAKAKKDIQVGDDLIVEKPSIAVLLEKYCKTHCQTCFLRTTVPLACSRCIDVVFCSDKCMEQAMTTFHKYECGILPIIWRSGASINCHMALRIISNKSVDYFNGIKDDIERLLEVEDARQFPHDDYRRICNLVRHDEKRNNSSFFQYSLMANFLTSCLQQSEYFSASENSNSTNFIYIGSLILRNLQFLQYNSHEIFELHKIKSGAANKTVFIGAGIYPTLSLFNHSCDPGVVRYFQGCNVHVNAIKPIKSGEIIAENYGPLYTQERKEDRQHKLKDLYSFDCNCTACLNNWPTFDEMDSSVIRFRCDAEKKCENVIEISADCNDFMIKCIACGQFTNILKGLKVMQDTDMINKTAKRLCDAGEISKALEKYIDLLRIMNEVLAPPFVDFCQCQQNIKDCFLHFGNSYVTSE